MKYRLSTQHIARWFLLLALGCGDASSKQPATESMPEPIERDGGSKPSTRDAGVDASLPDAGEDSLDAGNASADAAEVDAAASTDAGSAAALVDAAVVDAPSEAGTAVEAGPGAPDASAGLSYVKDLAPLVERHCLGCHGDEEDAPFPLTSYGDVVEHIDEIAEVVPARIMPACGGKKYPACGLSDAEIDLFVRWTQQGGPR